MVSLEELLLSRDNRRQLQVQLLSEFKDKTLICLTVVMPGNVKRNGNSLLVAKAAKEELLKVFDGHIIYMQDKDLQTGYEFYLITDFNNIEAKKLCCGIEETHPLGRLFDIDVLNRDGIPINREQVGYGKRKCLLCDNEARFCMRNFTHTQEEIQQHINEMIAEFKV